MDWKKLLEESKAKMAEALKDKSDNEKKTILAAATDALVAHPAYEPGLDQLWTLADSAELVIGPDEMEALVAHDRGLALRYYALRLRAAGQDVRVFVTEAAAEDWLRVPHALRVAL